MADVPFTTYAFDTADAGTVPRTLPNRLAEIINVRDFGAKGDGVTDDWAAIMAAFNHGQVTLVASGPSTGGDTLHFASVPASIKTISMFALNVTNPSSIVLTGIVLAIGATTVTVQGISQIVQTGDVITFNVFNKGTIYFPPGNYIVSQPINWVIEQADRVTALWLGEFGASTITGNFADYVISRGGDGSSNANENVVENLNIVNTNAAGGGIRLAMTTGGAIRNCSITANKGINTVGLDDRSILGAYFGSFEISIENCKLSPGSNVSGSQGILAMANGPIMNCQFIGLEFGIQTFGGQGAQNIMGCYFEQCGTGVLSGVGPTGTLDAAGAYSVTGCWFKNCSIAIRYRTSTSGCLFQGLRIEGTNGQAPSGGNSQYGLLFGDGGSGTTARETQFAGITVTGQYDVAGISFPATDSFNRQNTLMGVQSVSWVFPASADAASFIGCNHAAVYTFANINAAPDEGDSVNVSNSNSATWGATAAGGGSTHAKLRYNGSAWTVVGK